MMDGRARWVMMRDITKGVFMRGRRRGGGVDLLRLLWGGDGEVGDVGFGGLGFGVGGG